MTVGETLDYLASFWPSWNREVQQGLLNQFRLDARKKVSGLSKGERTQLALIGAIAAQPDLLVLDEPTAGLDPLVRREFIRTVIGAYQEAAPGRRTVLISTHLISEFEGLIDEFTIVKDGRAALTLESDQAREKFQKIHARFSNALPPIDLSGVLWSRRDTRELEVIVNGNANQILDRVKFFSPQEVTTEALTLEEIFIQAVQ
jgi:ABC-2 type transport system ATP-binding protein